MQDDFPLQRTETLTAGGEALPAMGSILPNFRPAHKYEKQGSFHHNWYLTKRQIYAYTINYHILSMTEFKQQRLYQKKHSQPEEILPADCVVYLGEGTLCA